MNALGRLRRFGERFVHGGQHIDRHDWPHEADGTQNLECDTHAAFRWPLIARVESDV